MAPLLDAATHIFDRNFAKTMRISSSVTLDLCHTPVTVLPKFGQSISFHVPRSFTRYGIYNSDSQKGYLPSAYGNYLKYFGEWLVESVFSTLAILGEGEPSAFRLQELIAPPLVEFFSLNGNRLGDKKSLEVLLHKITEIPVLALRGSPLSDFSFDVRVSWARNRDTKREEDLSYSLLGILDMSMSVIYGEGKENAFRRLKREWRYHLDELSQGTPTAVKRLGALPQTLKGHSSVVSSVAFSPDSRVVASASYDTTVRLWDAATGALQQILKGHNGRVNSVTFSLDSRVLASASIDTTVRLWDTATGVLQRILEGHSDGVSLVAFSPDSRVLASASHDRTVRLWDAATGALLRILRGNNGRVNSVTFSLDSRVLASASIDTTVWLWDTATGAPLRILKGHSDEVSSVAFSPDSRVLASASCDMTVRLWDTATGALQQILKGHNGEVYSVAFSPDSRVLASASYDMTVRLWSTVAWLA